jgi:hypothetical protein
MQEATNNEQSANHRSIITIMLLAVGSRIMR